MFSVHTTPEESENSIVIIICYFGLRLKETLAGRPRDYHDVRSFSNSSIDQMFSVCAKTHSRRFTIPLVLRAFL